VVGTEERNNSRLVFSGVRTLLSEVWESGKQIGCRLRQRKNTLRTAESGNDKLTLIASTARQRDGGRLDHH
jgi:hypothetical protein